MNPKPETNQAEPADLPDDTDISVGANYEATWDPSKVVNPQDGFHYFDAADDGDSMRPDGVNQLLMRGYQPCTEEHTQGQLAGHKLLRIPTATREKQRNARLAAANRAARTEGNTIQGVPEADQWQAEDHGRMRKMKRK